MTAATPPGWYPDPSDPQSGQLRWWDGTNWTEHLQAGQPAPTVNTGYPAAGGQQAGYPQTQPATGGYPQTGYPGAYATQGAQAPASAAQGHQYGDQSFGGMVNPNAQPMNAGYRSPMTEQVLLVSQKRKLIELTNEYAVFGQDGAQIGAVVEVGQSGLKKAMRFVSSLDQYMTHRLEVRDNAGTVLMMLTRPAKVFKSTVVVERPDGSEMGRLVQRNVFGKIRFGLEAGGYEVGSLNAENWRAWNFSLQDHTGTEVARITKTWEGLMTTVFTTADKYVVQIHRPLSDPLKSLVVASALTVDTALKQDSRGFG